MRTNLELVALEEFARQHSQEQLDILNELLQKQVKLGMQEEYEELIAADNAFHRQFFVAVGQRFSWEQMEQSSTHYYRVRLLHVRAKGAVERILFQHQELIHSVEQGKVQEARSLLRRHLFRLDEEEGALRERYPDYFLPQAVRLW